MGEPFQLGRYALHAELAAGGMAVVYLARQTGPVGFGKTVAIKRLHPHLAKDPYFAAMFLDEARLAARVQHPNVVPILDVVSTDGELFLVLEYVRVRRSRVSCAPRASETRSSRCRSRRGLSSASWPASTRRTRRVTS